MPASRLARGALPRAQAAASAPSNTHAARVQDVFYPSSDGKPMADNMWQSRAILNAVGDIEAAHPEALVAADILIYPEKGNKDNKIAPDVLMAFGLGTESRSVYKVWEEGKPPDWVLEVASPSTESKDRGHKRDYYAAMGVPEYWLFDPKGDVYPRKTPRLQGLRLVDGEYRPLSTRLVDGKRMLRSKVLGLDVRADGELLRFRDPATGRDILHRPEVQAVAEQAMAAAVRAEGRANEEAARANREAAARAAAEARVAELEAAAARSGIDRQP